MSNGALCVKRLLTDRNFVIADDKADALWREIKSFWRQGDVESPVDPSELPEGLTADDVTCEPLIREIDEHVSGSLDTYPRECLLEAIARVCGGVAWPVNGDQESVRKDSFTRILNGLEDRNITYAEPDEEKNQQTSN